MFTRTLYENYFTVTINDCEAINTFQYRICLLIVKLSWTRMEKLVVLSKFRILCNHHYYPVLESFRHPKWKMLGDG